MAFDKESARLPPCLPINASLLVTAAFGLKFLGFEATPALLPAWMVCVARLLPAAVFSRPPRAVAPVPVEENLPRLSRAYLRATGGALGMTPP
jgi:hypothetical protein